MKPGSPLPPPDIAVRAGLNYDAEVMKAYLAEGASLRHRIETMLPEDWRWEGKRVLDFGCSSGRVLRHFLGEAEHAQFIGCDIDRAAIDWLAANMAPPLRCFVNGVEPPARGAPRAATASVRHTAGTCRLRPREGKALGPAATASSAAARAGRRASPSRCGVCGRGAPGG